MRRGNDRRRKEQRLGHPATAGGAGIRARLRRVPGPRGAARRRLRDEGRDALRLGDGPDPVLRRAAERLRVRRPSATPPPAARRPDTCLLTSMFPAGSYRTVSGRWDRTSTCSFRRGGRVTARTPSRRCSRSGRTRSAGSGPEASSPGSTIGPAHRFASARYSWPSVEASLAAARATGGLFDPTLRHELVRMGYDRSFEEIKERRPGSSRPAEGRRGVAADRGRRLCGHGYPSCGRRARPRRDREGHGRRRLARPAPGARGGRGARERRWRSRGARSAARQEGVARPRRERPRRPGRPTRPGCARHVRDGSAPLEAGRVRAAPPRRPRDGRARGRGPQAGHGSRWNLPCGGGRRDRGLRRRATARADGARPARAGRNARHGSRPGDPRRALALARLEHAA